MEEHKPDVVTFKLTPAQPRSQQRDYLWVECKKAALEIPSGWKDALNEATTCLISAHPNREVFLVVGIGTKCMLFVWDPLNTVRPQPQLSIESSRGGPNGATPVVWWIDPRIKIIQGARWADPLTGRLDPSHAYKLDCNTTTTVNLSGGGQQQVLAWGNQMGLIEAYLVAISNIVLGGVNPRHFA